MSSSNSSLQGYKELSSGSPTMANITSSLTMAANNSPLLKRLQMTRIKHLLSIKTKITPINKDINNMEPVELLSDTSEFDLDFDQSYPTSFNDQSITKSLPNSPIRSRPINGGPQKSPKKHSYPSQLNTPQPTRHNYTNSPTSDILLSEQNTKFRLSDSTISRRIQKKVKTVLSLPYSNKDISNIKDDSPDRNYKNNINNIKSIPDKGKDQIVNSNVQNQSNNEPGESVESTKSSSVLSYTSNVQMKECDLVINHNKGYLNKEDESVGDISKLVEDKHHVHIVNHSSTLSTDSDNIIPLDTPYMPSSLATVPGNWPISYHPIDEIRDVILARDSSKRFGIKLDRTSCGEQITYIVMILPGSVAQKSGLKVGDQIVRVDHFYVHQISMESLVEYIRAKKESVRIFFKARSLLVRAKVVQIQKEDNKFGLRLIRRVQGVFVDYVIPGSAADKAGLKEADQLLKINNIDVSHWSQEKATHLLKNSNTQSLTLHVYDATFAANDCLHKKNIFFDCNDSNGTVQNTNCEFENLNDNLSSLPATDCEFDTDNNTMSWPNTPKKYLQMDWKNHC